jgi:PmbA protein
LFVISSPSAASALSSKAGNSDLFDQSALGTLAQRLVEAAKRAGADAADAVAVRGISQGVEVRDGRVEESERSEGDDVGLRVLVGRRQAVVSTNDISGDGVSKLAERAVAMARVAPDDKYVGLADPSLLARDFPDLDLLDPKVPSTTELERRACEAEAAALAVRRRIGLDWNWRHGTGDQYRLPRLLSAFEPGHLDDGDRRRRHRDGARLRLHLGAARLRSGFARKRRPQGG